MVSKMVSPLALETILGGTVYVLNIIMYWFILVELVYTGKFTLILSLLNLKLALVHLWGRVRRPGSVG